MSGQDAFRLKMLLPAPTHVTYNETSDAATDEPADSHADVIRTQTVV